MSFSKKGKKQSMKKMKNNKPQIPNYVNTMFDNWENLIEDMDYGFERNFNYVQTKSESISCLGLVVKLTNPKTNKPFSIIISDDLLEGDEIVNRLNYGNKVGGDLTKIGDWLDKRKTEITNQQINVKKGTPIQIELLNGVEQNKKHPTTFHIPSDEKKSKVEVGDIVKIVDIQYGERFWVIVKEFISDELMVGEINNTLVNKQPYSLGDKIFLTKDNIIDVNDEEYREYVKEKFPNILKEGTFDKNDNDIKTNDKK